MTSLFVGQQEVFTPLLALMSPVIAVTIAVCVYLIIYWLVIKPRRDRKFRESVLRFADLLVLMAEERMQGGNENKTP